MTQYMTGSIIAMLLAVAGAGLGVNLGAVLKEKLQVLVHIATGALLGITAFDILPEAKAVLAWPLFLTSAVAGYALLWLVNRFVFYVCPSCAIAHIDESTAMARRGSLILLTSALGIHCLLDGMALSSSAALSHRAELGAMLGVSVHKLPEGLALGLLLLGGSYSKRSALGITAAIEAITVLGAFCGGWLPRTAEHTSVGVVFAVVGGGFVYLIYNAFDGAFEHKSQMPQMRRWAAEAVSFLATGALFWLASRA